MADKFLDLPENEKKAILVKNQSSLNLPSLAIEKDIWVCWVLQTLFSITERPKMAFKGGTSLSKIYGAIARFSEDVDVTIDHQTWKNPEKDPFASDLSNSQIGKIAKEYEEKTKEFIQKTVIPAFEKEAATLNIKGIRIEFDGKEALTVVYPTVMIDSPDIFDNRYMKSNILVEFGGKNSIEPNNSKLVVPELSALIPDLIFPSASVDVLDPERTFWEKATLIHVECNRTTPKKSFDRLSRHWYDLFKLESHEIGEMALQNVPLLKDVIKFKKVFFHSSYANYDDCIAGRFKLYPQNEEMRRNLEEDYEKMKKSSMFREEPPDFNNIMLRMKEIETQINTEMEKTQAMSYGSPTLEEDTETIGPE